MSSRKTSTSTRPRSAPNDTKRTVSYGATASEIIHFYLRTENENTFLFFLLPLFDAFLVLVKTGPVAALMCRNASSPTTKMATLANLSLKANTSKSNSIWNAPPRLNEFLRTPKFSVVNKLQLQLQIQMRCKSSLRKQPTFRDATTGILTI